MAEPISCPGCQRLLNVPETFHGQLVQCPDCSHQFLASFSDGGIQAEPPLFTPTRPMADAGSSSETRNREQDDYRRDDRPMARRSDLMPHRGTLILTLGIISIFIARPIFGSIAWVLGNVDLKAMKEGRMDPSGEAQTRAGRMIGKVIVIIQIVLFALLIVGVCIFLGVSMLSAPEGHH